MYKLTLPLPPSVNLAASSFADIPTVAGIYQITNVMNGYRYIGSAKSLRMRLKLHVSCLINNRHHNPKLQAAWNKYGAENFSFAVVEFVDDLSELIATEQRWLDTTEAATRNDYYNFLAIAGSGLGATRSEETKRKIAASHTGKTHTPEAKEKMRAAKIGRKLTDEHKRKIGEKSKGNPGANLTEEQKQRFRKLTPEQVRELFSLHEQGWTRTQLHKHYGIGMTTVCRILDGESYRSLNPNV